MLFRLSTILLILSLFPLITIWPGQLSFEISAIPSLDLFLFITSFIKSTSAPNTAAIAPTFTGTASCIDLPLSFKILAPSFKVKEFEQIKEVYSPNE